MQTGDTLTTSPLTVSRKEIIEFATLWDPQPFHISEEAAQQSPFGELIGSGLHSLCAMVRLGVDSGFLTRDAIAGIAIDNLRFRSPLKPGMEVFAEFKATSARQSSKDPTRVIATVSAVLKEVGGAVIITADLVNLYLSSERLSQ